MKTGLIKKHRLNFRPGSIIITIVSVFAFVCLSPMSSSADETLVAKIKAGCLYHLAKLVSWPDERFEDEKSPIVIGFIGSDLDVLADYFKSSAKSHLAQDRMLEVIMISLPEQDADDDALDKFMKQISETHILYFGNIGDYSPEDVFKQTETGNILTVGGTPEFTRQGGMVGFSLEKGTMKIRVNLDAVENAGITISARFLQHTIITREPGEADNKSVSEE